MKDKFTEEEFRAAYDAANRRPLTGKPFIDKVIEELTRPEPEFSEGEVLIDKYQPWQCITVNLDDCMKYLNYRPLTLTEHGKDVRDLIEGVESVASNPGTAVNGEQVRQYLLVLKDRFNAAVKDD